MALHRLWTQNYVQRPPRIAPHKRAKYFWQPHTAEVRLTYNTTELYSLFEKGMIDATFYSFASMQSYKGQEVTKYATLTNLGSFAMGYAMNLQRYNSLPEDLRKIIDDVSKERIQNSATGKIYDQKEVEGLDVFKKAGINIYQPTADELKQWRQTSDQVVDSWIDDAEKKGLKVRSLVTKLKEIAAKYK